MMYMRAVLLTLVSLVILAGCQAPVPGQIAGRPGLPAALPDGPAATAPRLASVEGTLVIHGDDYLLKSADAAPGVNSLYLVAPAGETAWAVYQISGLSTDYRPLRLDLEFQETGNAYYIALSNYERGRWEYQPGTYSGDAGVILDANWTKYASAGSMYVAVLEVDSAATFEKLFITIDDTRPLEPPTGLAGTPLAGAAALSWTAYPDPRADTIFIYQGSDITMADAVQVDSCASTAVSRRIDGLTNGQPYFFGITAFWFDGALQSPLSNIVEVVPEGSAIPALDGLWPRRGNREDNRGCTTNIGPPSFTDFVSLDLAGGRPTTDNRTTPAIDTAGRVYALTGDAVLHCVSSDLTTTLWTFKASDHGSDGAKYFSPAHSPIIDNGGNSYFVAALEAGSSGLSYLFCVDTAGGLGWSFPLADLPTTVDLPFPTPTISPDGWVIVCHDGMSRISAINPDTWVEEWFYVIGGAEIYGDLALSGAGHLQLPAWHTGVGIPESLLRFISLDSNAEGSFVADWRDMGAPRNIFGGLSLADGRFLYPQQANLELLNALTGSELDSVTFMEALTAPPARNVPGTVAYQLHPPFGFSGFSNLNFVTISDTDPPTVSDLAGISLHASPVSSQPAVDGTGTVFFPTDDGTLYRVEFDPGRPIGDGNPQVTAALAIGRSDTYKYNSFAIGVDCAYIVTEQNMLYCIYNALD